MNKSSVSSLIITLKINDEAQQFFDEQRKKYFPAYANFMQSHLTLFHKLPLGKEIINDELEKFSQRKSFDLQVTGVKNIGNGAAYEIESAELGSLHQQMQQAFQPFLISRDMQVLWPHITVQNKVTAYRAKLTAEKLSGDDFPVVIKAVGFSVWVYLKKYWEYKQDYIFNEMSS